MVFHRVEHVERVEDWENGLSHKERKGRKDGFWRWGFTPYPECELIIRDSTLFGVWGKAPALKIPSASLRLCDSALKTFACCAFFAAKNST